MTHHRKRDAASAEGPAPCLRVDNFNVQYPNARIGPIDIDFHRGERVAVVGANGAGKSTMLKAVAGRLPDYEGAIELGGKDLRDQLPEARAHIGFLPEKLLGFGWMSVAEHLDFLSHFFPAWDRGYAEELMDRMELPAKSRVGTLSKGMAIKLSLVAAEAPRPPLLVLDEPTSGVDPVMRGEILDVINTCAPLDGDRLVLYSSHILEDVEQLASRVVCMKGGRILSDDPPDALRQLHPGLSMSEILYHKLQRASNNRTHRGRRQSPAPDDHSKDPAGLPRVQGGSE